MQSDPFFGTWQLNPSKSKSNPRPGLWRSLTLNLQAEGQGIKATLTGDGADGNPAHELFTAACDGMPRPVNDPDCDAIATTWVDTYTLIDSRTKAGKFVGIQTSVVSPDGKTLTITTIFIDANGRPFNNIRVFDKQ
jgi:hypothetical protein